MEIESKAREAEQQHIPKVTIGMPVYNGQLFVRAALDALLAQTFTDFELIISDNASTDNTESICREYAVRNTRIRYVRHNENRGALANFQYVLDEARGKYFMWAAADDLLGTRETLANLVNSLGDQFQLAIPDVNLFDEAKGTIIKGVLSSIFSSANPNNITAMALEYPSFQIYGLFVTTALRQHFVILKKNADLSCFGEGIFVHVISMEMKCAFVDTALLIYRRHSINASSTVIPPVLLISFFIYSYRVLVLYARSSFSVVDKLSFLCKLGFKHAKYILYLIVGTGEYYLQSALRYLRAHVKLA